MAFGLSIAGIAPTGRCGRGAQSRYPQDKGHIFDLRPDELEGKDLDECLSGLLRELSVNTLVITNLIVQDDGKGNPCRLLSHQQTQQLFRIASEAMTNILKHARARSVQAELSNGRWRVQAHHQDDGVGVDQARKSLDGQGRHDMRQRAELLRGRLTVEPRDTGGTIVSVAVAMEVEI